MLLISAGMAASTHAGDHGSVMDLTAGASGSRMIVGRTLRVHSSAGRTVVCAEMSNNKADRVN